MTEIIPGILEKDWSEIEARLKLVQPFAKWVQIDLLDGKFAGNTTFLDPEPFSPFSNSLSLELHMMVEEPEQYIEPFAKAGFRRFIGHVEKMSDQAAFVARAQLWGEVGLALDAKTGVDAITVPFDDLETILIMTVKAGFSGQEFQKEYLEKCLELRKKTELPLEVDGGVNQKTLPFAAAAGVNRFVVTSSLFEGDVHHNYLSLTAALDHDLTS